MEGLTYTYLTNDENNPTFTITQAPTKFGFWLNKTEYPNAKAPERAHRYDAGFDLFLALESEIVNNKLLVPANGYCIATTGVHLKLQSGWEAQIRPRSGNAAKLGITVLNSPGTIDSEYCGELKVILQNTTSKDVLFGDGDKIAQMVIKKVPDVELEELSEKPTNDTRGESGFGSTGQ